MVCELMELSGERFDTKVDEIDLIPADVGYSVTFDVINGGLSDIVVVNPGSGYTSSTTFTITNGAGAVLVPSISNGQITSIDVSEPGAGYNENSNILVAGAGNGFIGSLVVTNNKIFEINETVTGTLNTARAISEITNGELSGIHLYKSGKGYTTAPDVTLSAPPLGGTQATATAEITNGVVTSITIDDAGSGYTTPPEISIEISPLEPKGRVIRFDYTNNQIELIDVVGKFIDNDVLRGVNSGSEWSIKEFSTIDHQNDPLSDSLDIETEADSIIDWTETNPFGEYGDMGVF
jgi:hypothetical protein